MSPSIPSSAPSSSNSCTSSAGPTKRNVSAEHPFTLAEVQAHTCPDETAVNEQLRHLSSSRFRCDFVSSVLQLRSKRRQRLGTIDTQWMSILAMTCAASLEQQRDGGWEGGNED
eukprot:768073-Rhodomonas_salina.2